MIKAFLMVFFGGGVGSMMRYGIQRLLHERLVATAFPWETLTVNIAGSFLIGVFYALSAKLSLSDETRLLLTTGLCGGFTTFSTFSHDSLGLLRQGEVMMFVTYVVLSVLLGLVAVVAGMELAK